MAVESDIGGMKDQRKREAKAAALVADTRPVVERLYSLWHEMQAQGWRDMLYAPRDGTEIEMIEMGSIGIFKAAWHSHNHNHKGQQHLGDCGCFFGEDGGDLWPMRGVMWRPIKAKE